MNSSRVALALAFVAGAAAVTLLFYVISLVALAFVAGGAGLAYLSVRAPGTTASTSGAAQVGFGLGLFLGLPVYYSLVVLVGTVGTLLTAGPVA